MPHIVLDLVDVAACAISSVPPPRWDREELCLRTVLTADVPARFVAYVIKRVSDVWR